MKAALLVSISALFACAPKAPLVPDSRAQPTRVFDALESMSDAERRDLLKRQFDVSRQHGGAFHLPIGCPMCADPMTGILPDFELIDGPADVWN